MLRMSKLTDYGTVVLAEMARDPLRRFSAQELADRTHIGSPTVAKILKAFSRADILDSHRGAQGGYTLARAPDRISAVEIIDAIEGPVALTECASGDSTCNIEAGCSVGHNWQNINIGIRDALEGISLAQLIRPMAIPLIDFRERIRP